MQTLTGTVIEGEKRGASLGFPTANIALADTSLSGIYAGIVQCGDERYHAAVYADVRRGLLESHLLDFSGDLYGKEISVDIIVKIRDDRQFADEGELKAAIEDDIMRVRDYFLHHQ